MVTSRMRHLLIKCSCRYIKIWPRYMLFFRYRTGYVVTSGMRHLLIKCSCRHDRNFDTISVTGYECRTGYVVTSSMRHLLIKCSCGHVRNWALCMLLVTGIARVTRLRVI